ncbi:hypothetical protein BJ742DRAFT_771610 [Cladochytrium replicatum]|nr:hypothetical protein BJ742DRAFT_771610 [Cladochytrium replicatum]
MGSKVSPFFDSMVITSMSPSSVFRYVSYLWEQSSPLSGRVEMWRAISSSAHLSRRREYQAFSYHYPRPALRRGVIEATLAIAAAQVVQKFGEKMVDKVTDKASEKAVDVSLGGFKKVIGEDSPGSPSSIESSKHPEAVRSKEPANDSEREHQPPAGSDLGTALGRGLKIVAESAADLVGMRGPTSSEQNAKDNKQVQVDSRKNLVAQSSKNDDPANSPLSHSVPPPLGCLTCGRPFDKLICSACGAILGQD